MRILLDECVNPRLKGAFAEHYVRTVVDMGWAGVSNGKLLAAAQRERFHILITVDQNLQHQHDLSRINLGVIVVVVPDNHIRFFRPIFDDLRTAVDTIRAGQMLRVISPDCVP